jgi:hypothetical protein
MLSFFLLVGFRGVTSSEHYVFVIAFRSVLLIVPNRTKAFIFSFSLTTYGYILSISEL